MTTTSSAVVADTGPLRFMLTLEEPSTLVALHLVAAVPLDEKVFVVSLADPARPGESVVQGPSGWRFSSNLRSDFVYSPALNAGSIWSLEAAPLRSEASSLVVSLHPWGHKRSPRGVVAQAWASASNDSGHVTIYRMGNS